MMRGLTVKALITPNVLGLETSDEGLAKFGVLSALKISHRMVKFKWSLMGVVLMIAM
jgi:hypothetical protein